VLKWAQGYRYQQAKDKRSTVLIQQLTLSGIDEMPPKKHDNDKNLLPLHPIYFLGSYE
jgi:hypothetical protein